MVEPAALPPAFPYHVPTELLSFITVKQAKDIAEVEAGKALKHVALGLVPALSALSELDVATPLHSLRPRYYLTVSPFLLRSVEVTAEYPGELGPAREAFEYALKYLNLLPPIAAAWWNVGCMQLHYAARRLHKNRKQTLWPYKVRTRRKTFKVPSARNELAVLAVPPQGGPFSGELEAIDNADEWGLR